MIPQEMTEVVVRPDADLVGRRLPELRARLRDMVAAGARHVKLDLTDVRMIDSNGIGLLVATHNSLKKTGGKVDVINASKDILSLLRAMRIHQHMTLSGSLEEHQ